MDKRQKEAVNCVEKKYPLAQDMVFTISILIFLDALLLCLAPPDKSVFETACVHTVEIAKFTEHSCDFSTGLSIVIKKFTSASFESTV